MMCKNGSQCFKFSLSRYNIVGRKGFPRTFQRSSVQNNSDVKVQAVLHAKRMCSKLHFELNGAEP